MYDVMAQGAKALLLHGQVVGSWTIVNSNKEKSRTGGVRWKKNFV